MGYQTMQLRRGKPARWFKGVFYRPGVPIDPNDPNLSDPQFRLQLELVLPPPAAKAAASTPIAQGAYNTAELKAGDQYDLPLGDEDEDRED